MGRRVGLGDGSVSSRGRGRRLWLGVVAACALTLGLLAFPALAGAVDYVTNTSTGASIVPGTTDIGNHCDDCTTTITLPFPVSIYGTSLTSVDAGSNGDLQFPATSPPFDTFTHGCTPLPVSFYEMAILAFHGDLRTDGAFGSGNAGIFTATTGTAPNRQFIIEWRTRYFVNSGTGTANFEVILNENNSAFSIIYGPSRDAGSDETSGVQQASAPGSPHTEFSCGTATLTSGLRVDYTLGPAVTTGPASNVTANSATVTGTANPNGQSTMVHFEYGTTTGYGASTPDQNIGSGTGAVDVAANLTGLAPNTTYHYRLVGTNASGTTVGADQTFTTAAAAAAGAPSGNGGGGGNGGNNVGHGGNGGQAGICGGGGGGGGGAGSGGGAAGGGGCIGFALGQSLAAGRLGAVLQVAQNGSRATGQVRIGRSTVASTSLRNLHVGRRSLNIRLNAATLRRLRRSRHPTVTLRVVLYGRNGRPLTLVRTVSLR
jgi:hypothetical protein